jgi:hypothetical protein
VAKVNDRYELFKEKLSKETGITEDISLSMLMAKLKRAEKDLHKIFEQYANTGKKNAILQEQLQSHVLSLMAKHKSITVKFNNDPRGGAIRFTFKKTGFINTLGSDVCIDW